MIRIAPLLLLTACAPAPAPPPTVTAPQVNAQPTCPGTATSIWTSSTMYQVEQCQLQGDGVTLLCCPL
jgi:hypothetical protein